jgi:hypothetical protein
VSQGTGARSRISAGYARPSEHCAALSTDKAGSPEISDSNPSVPTQRDPPSTDTVQRTQRTAEARTEELERVLEKVNRGEFPVPAPGSSVLAVYAHEVQVQGSSGLIVRFADGAAARVDWDSQMLSREEMMR